MEEVLQIERDGAVAYVTLNRPALHNAFNAELIAALHAACAEFAADQALRVVVLRGAGPSFCAGADANWMRQSLAYSHAENMADAARLDAMLGALDSLPQAVVARVHGAALGGGVGLLACCDIVLAAENARFGFTEVRLGLIPAVIARFVITRIGPGHARALFVSGERFDALHARAIGLVHTVVAEPLLDQTLGQTLTDLQHCAPGAIAGAKALVRSVASLPAAAARDYAIEAIAAARTGAEGQAGLRAFLEKRTPDWVQEK